MRNKGVKVSFIRSIAGLQITLLVLATVAFAFVLSEANIVNAQGTTTASYYQERNSDTITKYTIPGVSQPVAPMYNYYKFEGGTSYSWDWAKMTWQKDNYQRGNYLADVGPARYHQLGAGEEMGRLPTGAYTTPALVSGSLAVQTQIGQYTYYQEGTDFFRYGDGQASYLVDGKWVSQSNPQGIKGDPFKGVPGYTSVDSSALPKGAVPQTPEQAIKNENPQVQLPAKKSTTDIPAFASGSLGAEAQKVYDKTLKELTPTLGHDAAAIQAGDARTAFIEGQTGFTGAYGIGGQLWEGLGWSLYVAGAVLLLGQFMGFDSKQTKAIGEAAIAGILAGKGTFGALHEFGGTEWADQSVGGVFGKGISWGNLISVGVGLAVAYFILKDQFKKEGSRTITFTCAPYEPPLGGANCEKCNTADPYKPCSEYRCKSLGQACQLLNKDAPGKEKCAWVNPKDVTSPTITPWIDVLSPLGLSYINDTSIRPPALGVKIERGSVSNKCLQAFTLLQFGVNTNEPARCKVDFNMTSFDKMQFYFGESNLYAYNHTQRMRMPGPDTLTTNTTEGSSPVFKNDGTTQLFVECMDANGNYNYDAYSIKFCVDPSPDTTPPQIEGTSITSGNPVSFGTQNTSIEVYVNEPSECKWSITDKDFGSMENNMTCETSPGNINAFLGYTCIANLTGLKSSNNEQNKFFFRCKDQPTKEENVRNVMVQSYDYTLRGSQPLNIINVSPNETVTSGTSPVTVDLELETANGADEGNAWCYFSPSGANDSYVQMFETNDYKHKQTLQLTPGFYPYYFRCTDLGGNSVEAKTNFTVFSDTAPPQVARVYREAGVGLKIVTDEDAECVYSLSDCNFEFESGLPAAYTNPNIKSNSYVEWKPNTIYYVKCRDLYGNEPNPAECSKIIKPVESTRTV